MDDGVVGVNFGISRNLSRAENEAYAMERIGMLLQDYDDVDVDVGGGDIYTIRPKEPLNAIYNALVVGLTQLDAITCLHDKATRLLHIVEQYHAANQPVVVASDLITDDHHHSQVMKMLDLLVHASRCRSPHCQYPNCRKVKRLFQHGSLCKVRVRGGCVRCKKMWHLLNLHARACKQSQSQSECKVPRCRDLKEFFTRLGVL